jgi:hypothetical protein
MNLKELQKEYKKNNLNIVDYLPAFHAPRSKDGKIDQQKLSNLMEETLKVLKKKGKVNEN